MKYILITPAVIALILGFYIELEEIAQQTSKKTLEFSSQALDAIDCAYTARPLTECAPELFSNDFKEDIKKTNNQLKQLNTKFYDEKTRTQEQV